ncbi:MAG: glutamate racemase [Anaerolineae bacterium]|jgi:glutamate racemase|nr:glutamate racemase [Anaerolineae bacterium]
MASIGIFDSGLGGLSVWREVVRCLPEASTLYFADQAHVPYGPRPLEEVRQYTKGITAFLLSQGADLIVVACNTASGAALHALRQTFPDVPIVGMEPAVKPAAERTRSGVIGVIATPATFQGDLFQELVERFAAEVRLETQACPGLVDAVEAGDLDTPETAALLKKYLQPMLDAGIDHLVLGCTHYPFLSAAIAKVAGPGVTLIDPAPAVARQVARLLDSRKPAGPPHHRFYTTGDRQTLITMAQQLVGYTGPVLQAKWEQETTVTAQPTPEEVA